MTRLIPYPEPDVAHLFSSQLWVAIDYINAGISIIPILGNGSKKSAIRSWNPYRERFANENILRHWFLKKSSKFQNGIGIVCGVLSGGLEVIDFDHDPGPTFHAWSSKLPSSVYGKLCVVETGSFGIHVLYRSSEVCGNIKIAMTADDKPKTVIESRGEGGYIVAIGSPLSVHASGNPYIQVMGPRLPEVPVMTLDERRIMWEVAATFDQRPDPMAEYIKRRRAELHTPIPQDMDPSKPWDDFDMRADWVDILGPFGWTTSNGIDWARPGKTCGTSAKIVVAKSGVQVLTVFSGNAGPLAPEGTSHKSWGKFAAFVELNHSGDRRAAAREARKLGYGGKDK